MLEKIKRMLELSDDSKDPIINDIIEIMSQYVMSYCGIDEIPKQLEFIVVETSIIRYNRLGAEGLSSESIDVIKSDYVADIMSNYYVAMDKYMASMNENPSKRIRFF